MIHVCPLSRLPETFAAIAPSRLISLLGPSAAVERPPGLAPEHHLRRTFHDIAEEMPNMIAPSRQDVDSLLAFGRAWDGRQPLLVHCYAGISRSTAAAFIIAAARAPERAESDLAEALRRASPTATPNSRLIALADDLLGRGGRMVAAVQAIGRGKEAFEALPFTL